MSQSLRSPVLHAGAILVTIFSILHLSAGFFYLYWVYWWFDMVMHFLAGFGGALLIYWVLTESSWGEWVGQREPSEYYFVVVSSIFILGVGWEFFEYWNGLVDSHEGYLSDVVVDLVLDVAGAFLAVYITMKRYLRVHG